MSSATSTTKSTEPVTKSVFATVRFSGDRLDPDRVSAILQVSPTKAWRSGETYFAGRHTGFLVGRTGTWFLATDDAIAGADLEQHLDYLADLLLGNPRDRRKRLPQVQELMRQDNLKAAISCFWRGREGDKPPIIPAELADKLRSLPAELDVDFDPDAPVC